jgi:hypothetical protein
MERSRLGRLVPGVQLATSRRAVGGRRRVAVGALSIGGGVDFHIGRVRSRCRNWRRRFVGLFYERLPVCCSGEASRPPLARARWTSLNELWDGLSIPGRVKVGH